MQILLNWVPKGPTDKQGSQTGDKWLSEQSGTKPNLVAKILATNFGFVPDCWTCDEQDAWCHMASVGQNGPIKMSFVESKQKTHLNIYSTKMDIQAKQRVFFVLTHWGQVMHICVSKLTIIGSDNGKAPGWGQAIIWANAGILFIGPLGKKLQWNLDQNLHIFIQEFENVWKMAAILS